MARHIGPCPRCACMVSEHRASSDGEVEWIRCQLCGQEGPLEYSKDAAIEAWNTSPRIPAQRAVQTVASIPDEELLRRAVKGCAERRKSRMRQTVPLWANVMERFGLGSTYAWQLCVRFGLDPDEDVGKL